MQSNSYMNATFSVCAARCGLDDGKYSLIGGSCIVDPEGKILAETTTKEDEVIVAVCDLDKCRQGKTRTFDFARHRRVEHYSRIVEQTGVIEPPRLSSETDTADASTTAIVQNDSHQTVTKTPPTGPPTSTSTSILTAVPSKQIRILLINPNSTPTMTTSCLTSLQSTLPPDVHITPFTGPSHSSPTAIESQTDNILSSAACFRALAPLDLDTNYDAVLVACYSPHALIPMLREEYTIPIIGIMEASLLYARTLGSKFGIIATSARSAVAHEGNVRSYGMEHFCAGIESCNLGVLDLENLPRPQVLGILRTVAQKLVASGAEVLTLGCAGMTGMKEASIIPIMGMVYSSRSIGIRA
jgi:Asp/Glu/hydantoin racemase